MISISANLNYYLCSKRNTIESTSCNAPAILCFSNDKKTQKNFERSCQHSFSPYSYISTSSSIRQWVVCVFHITAVFQLPALSAWGAVLPATTLLGDDFGDGADGVDSCCRQHNVSDVCRKMLCNPQRPPNDFEVYDIFERHNNCSKYLKPISHCLAAGRDHTSCCERDARDGDEHTCFSMCRGEDRCVHDEPWSGYQTCLAINIRSIFQCFMSGYFNGPTPPRKLSVESVAATSVNLAWHKPAINAHLITRYIIYVYAKDGQDNSEYNSHYDDSVEELYFETDEPRIELGSLEPGTKYRAHAVAVADETHRSLRSRHVDFQTAGIAPRVHAFKSPIFAAPNVSVVLLTCKYKVSGVSENSVNINWVVQRSSGNAPVQGPQFNQTTFLYSASKPREYVAILEISEPQASDFGTYKCQISDTFGEGSAHVVLTPVELHTPPSSVPPLTPLACCRGRDVDERCLPMCGGESTSSEISTRRYVARPFMPSNCSGDISKVLSCAMPEVDDSSCCLWQRVPRQCMYLCDSAVEPSNQMAAVCLKHVDAVVQCRMSGVDKRPTAVTGLRIETGGAGIGASAPKTAVVSWEPSKNAEIYHVYWRRKDDESSTTSAENSRWHQKSQNTLRRKVQDADEIIVVAANSYGNSQASKIAYDSATSKWEKVS